MARQGKIARLPARLRHELCERLADGQPGAVILPWINSQPETLQILEAHFGGEEINDANLTNWRQGGYLDWTREAERETHVARMAEHMRRLAAAGGGLAGGALAIAAGQLTSAIEALADGEIEGLDMESVINSLAKVADAEIKRERLSLDQHRHRTKEQEVALAREKFETQTVEQFLRWAGTKQAAAILDGGKPKHIQAALIREMMFGPVDTADDA